MPRNSLDAVSNPVPSSYVARFFLDDVLPLLAAPHHSLPATSFSFLDLSLLSTTLPSSKIDELFLIGHPSLIPKCVQPAIRLNREEFHVTVELAALSTLVTSTPPAAPGDIHPLSYILCRMNISIP
jgi:hypothetical protein